MSPGSWASRAWSQRPPNLPRLAGAVIAVTVLVIVIAVATSTNGRSARRVAPALPAEVLVGPRTDLGSLRGRAVAVTFWASWCQPCEHEAPDLERFAQSATGRGRLVGVDWSDGLTSAQAFLSRFGWDFPNLRDADGTVGNSYGIGGLPATFVLDRDGRVAATLLGPQTQASLETALRAADS